MSWLSKNIPTLFIEAPDGSVHFRLSKFCVYEDSNDINKTKKIYFFKNKISYILEETVINWLFEARNDFYNKVQKYINENEKISLINIEKDKSILSLEANLIRIEREKNLLEDAYGENLEEVINLKKEVSKLEGILESKSREKEELKEWFNSEINNREELIKSLRETINKFREELNRVANDLNLKNSDNIDKLRKEFEMLDKDFVDVAKSMGVFSNEESRPKRGYRIKL
ncbi:MAG: hypothetical protein M0Q13_12470 [Methanothrix sp.]|jgi:hypothetical protein|nr:hypothetical protein [Methanothrix sp.]